MPDPRRIRVVILEPTPGWWQLVKDQARAEQRLIGGLVVLALAQYLERRGVLQQEVHT